MPKRKLNSISGGKTINSSKRYKKRERNYAFTNKTKRDTLMRQGRFCSNYPNSPLSKLLGNHCDTYNNFDRYCMFLPGTEQYDHFIRREKSMNNTVDNCNILCCSCHSLKTKLDGKDEWQVELRKIMKYHIQDFKKNFVLGFKKFIESKYLQEYESMIKYCNPNNVRKYLDNKYKTIYNKTLKSFDGFKRIGVNVVYISK